MKILNISQTELNELINYSNDEIIKIENINLSGLYFKIPCKPIQIEGCIMQSTLMPQGNLCGYFRLTNCDLSNAKFPKTYYANNGSLCINNCTFDEDTQFPELIVGGDFRVQKMDLSNFDIPSVKDGKAEIYKCNFSPQTRFVGNSIADVAIVECNIDNLNMPAELNSLTLTECTHQAGFKMPETLGSLSISYCHLKNIDISSVKGKLVICEGIQEFIKRNAEETGKKPLTVAMVHLLIKQQKINAVKTGNMWLIPITDPPTIYDRPRSDNGIDPDKKKANAIKRAERMKAATRLKKLSATNDKPTKKTKDGPNPI